MPTSIDELLDIASKNQLSEHRHAGVELKSGWTIDCGRKLSALANRIDTSPKWMLVGVADDGTLLKKPESWARQTEQSLSQQINDNLNPSQACVGITCHELAHSWVVLVQVRNPGDVVYWGDRAYQAAGTTISEMTPEEVLKLRIRLPGLSDFSRQSASGETQLELVQHFQQRVAARGQPIEGAATTLEQSHAVLRALGLADTQAERILFGDCTFRLVRYSANQDPVQNERVPGIYTLLTDDFLGDLQRWAKDQLQITDLPFPERALREALANAVAHTAYFELDGDVIVEQHPDRVTIGNLCVRESTYFANRWFSRSHKTVNGLLMEALRVAGHVDELGRGKNLIFSESIRNGKTAPQVVVERAGRYDRWKLTLYGGTQSTTTLRLFDRCRAIYKDDQKALIAQALVLWRDRPVSEIKNYIDGDFARQFVEVLSDLRGPIFYYREKDRITLRRWAAILLGEGKDSKALSPAEERNLRDFAFDMQTKYHDGFITPKDLRNLAAMADTPSERVLSSSILKKWKTEGTVRRICRGQYRFVPRKVSPAETLGDLLELFRNDQEGSGSA